MSRASRLWQTHKVEQRLAPAADAACRTSGYFTLKNVHKAWIIANITQGNAATIALTPLQATAVAGTGSKVLTAAVPIVSNLDTAASDALLERTAAANYTTDAGVKNKVVIFEIDPAACMDINSDFDCIGMSTGGWQTAFAVVGAVLSGVTALSRMTLFVTASDGQGTGGSHSPLVWRLHDQRH